MQQRPQEPQITRAGSRPRSGQRPAGEAAPPSISAFRWWHAAIFLPLAATLIGCSSGDPAGGQAQSQKIIQKFTPSARVYTTDDLRAAGLRVNRDYDVAGLPFATSAHHGFLNQKEFEARLYASHADAATRGAEAALLVTGPKAVVTGQVPWEEGATDRRNCVGAINANCVARYGDFLVYGNIVLLCEGRDSETSLQTCQALVSRLPAP